MGREEFGQNGEDGLEGADVAVIRGGKALNDRKEKAPFRSEREQKCKHVAYSATPTAARNRGTTFAAGHSLLEYLKADDEGSTAVRDSVRVRHAILSPMKLPVKWHLSSEKSYLQFNFNIYVAGTCAKFRAEPLFNIFFQDPQKKVQEKEEVGGGMGQGEAETQGGETAKIQGKRILSADEECLSVDDGLIQEDSVLGSWSSLQHLPPNGLGDEELVEEQEASKEEGVEKFEGGDEGEPVTGGGILGYFLLFLCL